MGSCSILRALTLVRVSANSPGRGSVLPELHLSTTNITSGSSDDTTRPKRTKTPRSLNRLSSQKSGTRQDALPQTFDARRSVELVAESSQAPDKIGAMAPREVFAGLSSPPQYPVQRRQAPQEAHPLRPGPIGTTRDQGIPESFRLATTDVQASDTSQSHIVLPPKRTADYLYGFYWNHAHCILPCLDRQHIYQRYSSPWMNQPEMNTSERDLYCCTLNLIFTIASALDISTKLESQNTTASVFYNRARKLIYRNLFDVSHLHVLQNLLLAVQYLLSTKMSRECTRIMSLAAWMAQELKLDTSPTKEVFVDAEDLQLRRRVWHCCVVMDKWIYPGDSSLWLY